MNYLQRVLITAHPEFLGAALDEMRRLEPELLIHAELTPEIALVEVPNVEALARRIAQQHLIFVRHLAPVQAQVTLDGTLNDIATLALTAADLPTFSVLERGQRFAVQTRLVHAPEEQARRLYTGGRVNQELAAAIAEETGAVELIKRPRLVLSILCTPTTGYLGISSAQENLSDWPGGARHFAQTPEQISRAEFKLLEALEVFGLTLPAGGRALDLGAAPGGWTRLLLEAEMSVVAVDPAHLDPRLKSARGLEHYQGYAENYLEEAIKRRYSFDVIANDMRMDARDAARLLARAAPCLRHDGIVISTLKLPHAAPELDPVRVMGEALKILDRAFAVVQARQLFHNRQEVTVVAAQPRNARRI